MTTETTTRKVELTKGVAQFVRNFPCACGEIGFDDEEVRFGRDGARYSTVFAPCYACGREQEFHLSN